jgi:methanol---5-hydroxybenzimidazolylcobamide Co-methyltransferase
MKQYNSLAINDVDSLVFGKSIYPITLQNGLVIGGGEVYPELNFTLPDLAINSENLPAIREQYQQMIEECCKRAVELQLSGLVVEFELLPDLTLKPEWGADITKILKETLNHYQQKYGIKTALRVTPNDIREFARPPIMRNGHFVDEMFRSFELCAQAGADFVAIESTGGKEIHDDAILNGDLQKSVFSLGVLASRDIAFLWDRITSVSRQNGVIPSGDSACGFGNTAMVLAEKHFVPKVWAAVIRVMTIARSLVAFEHGAIGPGKDCAYENVYLKLITGCPMALEGAEAACAHLSPIGNIAKATPDLWSNESVQNVKLLSGMAPVVSLEQLVYATRLMNAASIHGEKAALELRDWLVESDFALDPQAYILRPDIALQIVREVINEKTSYLRTRRSALVGLTLLRDAQQNNKINLSTVEMRWLDKLSRLAEQLPEDEETFIHSMVKTLDSGKVRLSEYEID